MFVQRLLSGIVLLLVIIISGVLGGPVLAGFCLLISLVGMSELYKIKKVEKTLLGIVGYMGAISYYALIFLGMKEYIVLCLLITLVGVLACYVFAFPKFKSDQVMIVTFGMIYVALTLSYIYQVREIPEIGSHAIWLIFISSWGCDTCAYCVGVLFGKHKMAPILSPKKSIEGAIGGAVGAGLLGYVYGIAVNHFAGDSINPLWYAGICIVGGLCSMIGDLAASGIKRDNDVKDYGTLIPGHGGILDRFDSVIFTAPIIYYLLSL